MCVGDLNVILNIKHTPDMTLFFHQINLLLKRYSGVEWPRFIKQGSQINTKIKLFPTPINLMAVSSYKLN